MPKSRASPFAVVRAFDTINSIDSAAGTSAKGICVVTGTTRNVGPASIMTALSGATPQRSATNSV